MAIKTSAYNIGVALFVALGSFTYGFGFSAFSTSIGQPGFYLYFNLKTTGDGAAYTNSIIGALMGLFSFGAAVGALGVGLYGDKVGRKWSIIIASTISATGAALVAGSVHIAMLVVMRLYQGIGLGAIATLVPIYLCEIATPSKRGLLAGFHGIFLVFGYQISGWVGFATFFSKNLSFQWRFPLAACAIWPLILLAGVAWIPESPRWLLTQNRGDEALLVLQRLHYNEDEGDDQTTSSKEFYQIQKQVEYESTMNTSYFEIFRKPSWRKRALIGMGIQFAAQSSGCLAINNYSVLIYTKLGLSGYMPLLMYCLYTLVGSLGNIACSAIMDKVGRRVLLLVGFSGALVSVIGFTAMIASYGLKTNVTSAVHAGNSAGVFFLFLYVFFYGVCIDATSFVVSSEIWPTAVRSKGVALAFAAYFIGSIIYVVAAPTATANIGWKFYLIFICCGAVTVPLIYFFVPETKGLSLEDLEELFGDKVVVHLNEVLSDEKVNVVASEKQMEK